MLSVITCPNCNHNVDSTSRKCGHCGIDLAIAAAIAERDLPRTAELKSRKRVSTEILVPRLGEYLVERGDIQPADLDRAVAFQTERTAVGQPVMLGEALRQLDIIDRETLDQAVAEQQRAAEGSQRAGVSQPQQTIAEDRLAHQSARLALVDHHRVEPLAEGFERRFSHA